METEKFKLSDILYGLVIPLIVGLLIVAFPAVIRPALDGWFSPGDLMTGEGASAYAFLTPIFTHGFALMVMFAIPLILGLIWNKWAGGAAGFLLGTLLYLGEAGYNNQFTAVNYGMSVNLYADPSFIGNYIVGGILVGYIAGGLSNGSLNFKRMLGAGLTASLVVGALTFLFNMTVAESKWMSQADPAYALFLAMLPMIFLGIIAPIVAKVMTWYGLQPTRR
ncbi:MAG: hypothetical protein LBH74_05465 [Nitrososphaerota archaeon]|uniref:hypothetical protein n=1 Tax=Candidatus Bathycorpusculum sp. TaxID=2994959 RepID=UPI002818D486|nr:hypothetical protein [Candidatus Termitimicrobium sp.]MCL2432217.1 hypothetical protein [Candidatus Termitimicrobium sp.]MDR0493067.1 hypothetical protein [Nitrososphaerota archaeon]